MFGAKFPTSPPDLRKAEALAQRQDLRPTPLRVAGRRSEVLSHLYAENYFFLSKNQPILSSTEKFAFTQKL